MSREAIAQEALKLVGTPFCHQGRNPQTGVDCVGLVKAAVERAIPGYEFKDRPIYKRRPPMEFMIDALRDNFDEIPAESVEPGDFYLLKAGQRTRHIAVKVSDTHLVHATGWGSKGKVLRESIGQWKNYIVGGFRVK